MKALAFSVALGALFLITGSSGAQSGVMAAERLTASSSSQATLLSELVMPKKTDDLPDTPQATPVYAGSPAHSPAMAPYLLSPQTFHDKFMTFAVTTVGPRALVGPAFPAAIRMANPPSHYPKDWRQGAQGFGRNYGDQLATVATLQTGRFVVGAALHEDFRYHPSTSTNFFLRTGHAIGYTLVDRSDEGHLRPAAANLVGLGGASYVGMSYLPPGFNDVTHADQRLIFQFSRLVGSNIGAEFAPDIFRFFQEHHLPRPKIPIPEWWVKR